MTKKSNNRVEDYYDAVAEQYHQIYDFDDPSYKNGIADYFRLQIVLRIIAQNRCTSVFEVGVGDGTPLEQMHRMGLKVAGCDISPKMVETACQRLKDAGLDDPPIWRADVCNAVEMADAMMLEPTDVVVALGVLPHVEKDILALRNMRTLVRDGGKLLIEFRNKLFSLFTFNRFTHDFVVEELLASAGDDVRERVSETLKAMLRMDLPPVRDSVADGQGPGYDTIRAKFHNPFEIPDLLNDAGFGNPKFHWYHFHAAMPMLQDDLDKAFDQESMAMEHKLVNDWRGYFLCSACLVEADAT